MWTKVGSSLEESPIWAFGDWVPWSSYWTGWCREDILVPLVLQHTFQPVQYRESSVLQSNLFFSIFLDQLIEIGSFQMVQPSTSINIPYLRDDICIFCPSCDAAPKDLSKQQSDQQQPFKINQSASQKGSHVPRQPCTKSISDNWRPICAG